jgi:hypothetical protein
MAFTLGLEWPDIREADIKEADIKEADIKTAPVRQYHIT